MNLLESHSLQLSAINKKKIELIKEVVATYYKQPLMDFTAKSRKKHVVQLKHIAMWLTRNLTNIRWVEIGDAFNCNHATALHGCRQMDKYMILRTERQLQWEIAEIKGLLEMRIALEEGSVNLEETHHYINLNDCVGIKFDKKKGLVFSGFNQSEIDMFMTALNMAGVINKEHHSVENAIEFKDTGMHLLRTK